MKSAIEIPSNKELHNVLKLTIVMLRAIELLQSANIMYISCQMRMFSVDFLCCVHMRTHTKKRLLIAQ